MNEPLQIVESWLRKAPSVLVTAGAGLSAAAGINYTDEVLFKKHFPAMLQYGFRCQAQFIGFDRWEPELQWGYWAAHVNLVRHQWPRSPVYDAVAELIQSRDSFVLTSNVDAMFERHDVDASRVFTPQGDYAYLQCTVPCREETWTWQDSLDAIVASTDPATQRLTDSSLVPQCPHCGETVFPNVRVDDSFVDTAYRATGSALGKWLEGQEGPGVVLELGAGFNTPGVVRYPSESIVLRRPDWRLIRINMSDAGVPGALGTRAVGVAGDAAEVILALQGRGAFRSVSPNQPSHPGRSM